MPSVLCVPTGEFILFCFEYFPLKEFTREGRLTAAKHHISLTSASTESGRIGE